MIMQRFLGQKILLGVCGGVAAYKAAELARLLQQAGAEVQVIMTQSALDFVGVQTFQALTGKPVWMDINDSRFDQSMAHIDLSRWADILLIAPATANIMAKLAHGLADDLLSLVAMMMVNKPILICPAMNVHMWSHPATKKNQEILSERGVVFVGPDPGMQACGDQGLGRMREPEFILNALDLLEGYQRLKGSRFVITAGPTREAVDPVRYLSNHSSGYMGYALAEALAFAGAEVHLITGPCSLQIPPGVSYTSVESAQEMYDAVFSHLGQGDYFMGVAAVADYRPKDMSTQKIKKEQTSAWVLELEPTLDILAAVKDSGIAAKVIGFAAETQDLLNNAQLKLDKKADMIIANLVGYDQGFGACDSALTILTRNGVEYLASNSKIRLAGQLINLIENFIKN
jgi:phosphopantothenoylcysteine decarboxylase/phosphopantothenate--cysteine ligase